MGSAWRGLKTALAAIVNWRFFKPAVFVACAVELVWLSYDFYLVWTLKDTSALGVDPKKTLLHETGQTALLILLITLSVTPFRRIFSINGIVRVRRMLGLWSFTYALAHLTIYLGFDQLCFSAAGCQWRDIWDDIGKRPFIFMGMLAFVCLLLLALTSTTGWVRRLKKKLDAPASDCLCGRRGGGDPLHLDPEVRHQRAAEVDGLAGRAAALPRRLGHFQASSGSQKAGKLLEINGLGLKMACRSPLRAANSTLLMPENHNIVGPARGRPISSVPCISRSSTSKRESRC
jgi:DMSO/TMAO reductase YedYZ heme-binding membrane subunit